MAGILGREGDLNTYVHVRLSQRPTWQSFGGVSELSRLGTIARSQSPGSIDSFRIESRPVLMGLLVPAVNMARSSAHRSWIIRVSEEKLAPARRFEVVVGVGELPRCERLGFRDRTEPAAMRHGASSADGYAPDIGHRLELLPD